MISSGLTTFLSDLDIFGDDGRELLAGGPLDELALAGLVHLVHGHERLVGAGTWSR